VAFHYDGTELDDNEMEETDSEPDSHEHWVCGNILENVKFSLIFLAAIILKICKITKTLNTIVRCLDGVSLAKDS